MRFAAVVCCSICCSIATSLALQPPPVAKTKPAVRVTVERQWIVRGGPHPFREVELKIANAGSKPAYVFGSTVGGRFRPAAQDIESSAPPGAPDPAEVRHRRLLKPNEELLFTRSYSPSRAGKTMKVAVYWASAAAGKPTPVNSPEFRIE